VKSMINNNNNNNNNNNLVLLQHHGQRLLDGSGSRYKAIPY